MTDFPNDDSPFTEEHKRKLIDFADKIGETKYTMDDSFEFIFADLIKKYGDPHKVKAEFERIREEKDE